MRKIDELQELQNEGLGNSMTMSRQPGTMKLSPLIDKRLGALEDQVRKLNLWCVYNVKIV